MSARTAYRIAAVIFVLFALGHTVGFLTMKPPSAEAAAVRAAMDKVHFEVRGSSYSFGGFYVGFGFYITMYMIFSALLAWHLSNVAVTYPKAIGGLGWTFFGVQIAGLALALTFFSIVQATPSVLVAICLGWGAWRVEREKVISLSGADARQHHLDLMRRDFPSSGG
jgi:hypothetical protein